MDWLPNLLSLAQRGIRCHVSLFDRKTFNGERDRITGSSTALCDSVRQLGIDCNLVGKGEVGQPSEIQKRQGFWEFEVTGTGKVVAIQSPFDQF